MRVVRWVIVLLTIAVCAGAAALLTTVLLKVVGLDEYDISVAALVDRGETCTCEAVFYRKKVF